jgi:peptidoglycan/LPS O-acetylase OafA/YrhL
VADPVHSAYDDPTMIRFLFRFLGLLCLALAFILLVYDGTKSIADQRIYITSVTDIWVAVHEASLTQLRPAVERLSVWLWDPVVVKILAAPSALVLAIIGTVLILIGRKKRRLIGYARD